MHTAVYCGPGLCPRSEWRVFAGRSATPREPAYLASEQDIPANVERGSASLDVLDGTYLARLLPSGQPEVETTMAHYMQRIHRAFGYGKGSYFGAIQW